ARAQPLGRPLAIGDVPADQNHLIAAHGGDRPGKPDLAAPDRQAVLEVDRRPRLEGGADVLHELLGLRAVEYFPQRLAEQLGGRAPGWRRLVQHLPIEPQLAHRLHKLSEIDGFPDVAVRAQPVASDQIPLLARRGSASSSGLSSTSRIMRWEIPFWVMRA